MSARQIHLSLVSHTNVGKTTLARTFLGRDVGEVADRAHVTEFAEEHVLVSTPDGATLSVWDTPGFGDSVQIARRLQGRSNPIGWFVGEVWDRWTKRSLWLTQQALKHVRDQADVVLYLVNASEAPGDAPYVGAEMEILEWIGKPVVVLLNQMGPPRTASEEARDTQRWRDFMAEHRRVHDVLPLDAFARCWVQEFGLLDAIAKVLPAESQAAFAACRAIWLEQRLAAFDASMAAIADYLLTLAGEVEAVGAGQAIDRLKAVASLLGAADGALAAPRQRAMKALEARAAAALVTLTERQIAANGLRGKGVDAQLLQRLQSDWQISAPVNAGRAGLIGAAVTGAAGGLAADLAAGGLTLGAGALMGAILGAMGAGGLASGFNLVTGRRGTQVKWSPQALTGFLTEALLLYLAVAHFGRGRGDWIRAEYPEFWRTLVADAVAEHLDAFEPAWRHASAASEVERAAIVRDVAALAERLLTELYPQTPALLQARCATPAAARSGVVPR
ncbi:MAG: DUF3482 domain-containing protein [Burkholderiaceae bacterium]